MMDTLGGCSGGGPGVWGFRPWSSCANSVVFHLDPRPWSLRSGKAGPVENEQNSGEGEQRGLQESAQPQSFVLLPPTWRVPTASQGSTCARPFHSSGLRDSHSQQIYYSRHQNTVLLWQSPRRLFTVRLCLLRMMVKTVWTPCLHVFSQALPQSMLHKWELPNLGNSRTAAPHGGLPIHWLGQKVCFAFSVDGSM